MFGTFDRYIIKKFLVTFFFSVALIMAIASVIDLSEKIDDFIENNVSVSAYFTEYFINFLPSLYNLFSPLFIFISLIFFTSKLASNSEIVAVLSGGVSYNRFMRPYIIASIFLAALSFFLNGWIVPITEKNRIDFENRYINGRKNAEKLKKDIHRQLEPGTFLYLQSFNYKDSIGYRISLEYFKGLNMTRKISADRLVYDHDSSSWMLENYMLRDFSKKEHLEKGLRKKISIPNFNPEDFFRRSDDVSALNYSELAYFIKAEQMRGSENAKFYITERYRRSAIPFTTIILTIIGVCVSSRKVRGGVGIHLFLGIMIAASFLMLNQFTLTFANEGNFSPLLAVWIPNILYSFIAYYLYKKAPK